MPRYSQYVERYLRLTGTGTLLSPGTFLWATLEGNARRWFPRYRRSLVRSLERFPDAVEVVNRRGKRCWVSTERYLELQLMFDGAVSRKPRKVPGWRPAPVADRVEAAIAKLPKARRFAVVATYSREETEEVRKILVARSDGTHPWYPCFRYKFDEKFVVIKQYEFFGARPKLGGNRQTTPLSGEDPDI